jgi:hypothetical protein
VDLGSLVEHDLGQQLQLRGGGGVGSAPWRTAVAASDVSPAPPHSMESQGGHGAEQHLRSARHRRRHPAAELVRASWNPTAGAAPTAAAAPASNAPSPVGGHADSSQKPLNRLAQARLLPEACMAQVPANTGVLDQAAVQSVAAEDGMQRFGVGVADTADSASWGLSRLPGGDLPGPVCEPPLAPTARQWLLLDFYLPPSVRKVRDRV